MSHAILLKINDRIFRDTTTVLRKVKMPRNAYINQAINFYNLRQRRKLLRKQYRKEITALKAQAREVLTDFELLEDLPE